MTTYLANYPALLVLTDQQGRHLYVDAVHWSGYAAIDYGMVQEAVALASARGEFGPDPAPTPNDRFYVVQDEPPEPGTLRPDPPVREPEPEPGQ